MSLDNSINVNEVRRLTIFDEKNIFLYHDPIEGTEKAPGMTRGFS